MHTAGITATFQSNNKNKIKKMGSNSGESASNKMCAVVTGANKGIGLAIVRQLAEQGVTVVMTARDEKRGIAALRSLRGESVDSNILFHELDVQDPVSVASLAKFLHLRFGKLDILVNNAGASGASVDIEGLRSLNLDAESWLSGKVANIVQGFMRQTYDDALNCIDTNYFGCKRVTEALLPLLKESTDGAKIVNLSSIRGELKRIPNEKIRAELNDVNGLNERVIGSILQRFLKDMKDGKVKENGWPNIVPSYSISKAAVNAYTRVVAKRYPDMHINCVHPGFVKTDLNFNMGVVSTEEGARGPVMLALMARNCVSGCYFDQTILAEY